MRPLLDSERGLGAAWLGCSGRHVRLSPEVNCEDLRSARLGDGLTGAWLCLKKRPDKKGFWMGQEEPRFVFGFWIF